MNVIQLNQMRWHLSQFIKALGFWGLIGLVLTLFAMVNYFSTQPKLENSISELQAKIESNKHVSNVAEIQNQEIKSSVEFNDQQLQTVYASFPFETSLPRLLSRINQLAVQQKLILNTGDYKLKKLKQTAKQSETKLVEYEIVFPIKGSYLAMRNFISAVLKQLPTIALDALELKRENTTSTEVEARLTFVLFAREDSK